MSKEISRAFKDAANRQKARALGKLKWYCEVCSKQCRDENGFRNHCDSEPHRQRVRETEHTPEHFGHLLEDAFLDILRTRHPRSKVKAAAVYQEYILDRHHVHMNATPWASLTDFVAHLGRSGKCKVEEFAEGLLIQLVPSTAAGASVSEKPAFPIVDFTALPSRKRTTLLEPQEEENEEEKEEQDVNKRPVKFTIQSHTRLDAKRPKLSSQQEEPPSIEVRQGWLCSPGLIVKITDRSSPHWYKTAVVRQVSDDGHRAMVCVLPKASVEEEVPVSVDEKQVAPVHPAPGGLVYILRGAYQFATGRIVEVRPASQMAVVQLQSQGSTKERGSITVPLADVCKYEEATQ